MVYVYDTKCHGRLVHQVQVMEMMKHYGVIKAPLVQAYQYEN